MFIGNGIVNDNNIHLPKKKHVVEASKDTQILNGKENSRIKTDVQ
jgi:hypothetical protein